MKLLSKILPILLPALLVSDLCIADPLNSDWGKGLGVIIALLVIAFLFFVATPVICIVSLRSPGRLLYRVAWVMAVTTKVISIPIAAHFMTGFSSFRSLSLFSLLPDISLIILLIKAGQELKGRLFMYSYIIRAIVSIIVAGTLFTIFLGFLVSIFNYQFFLILTLLLRFCLSVWFVYRFLRLAATKEVVVASGILTPVLWSFVINLCVFLSSAVMLLFRERNNLALDPVLIINILIGPFPSNIMQLFGAAASGVVAYILYTAQTRNNTTSQ